jgi:hypothetical protein
MKYMHIGDLGLSAIAKALEGDMIVTELNFSNARVSSLSVRDLAKSIGGDPDSFSANSLNLAMSALRILDLSSNLICNDGAYAIADAMYGCHTLESVSLAGNRIEIKGALSVTDAVLDAPHILFLSLKNNFLTEEDLQTIAKVLDEQEYRDNSGQHAVTVPSATGFELMSEKERMRQIQVLKAGKRLKSMAPSQFRSPNTSTFARCYYFSGKKQGGVFKWVGQELDTYKPPPRSAAGGRPATGETKSGGSEGGDGGQEHFSQQGRVPGVDGGAAGAALRALHMNGGATATAEEDGNSDDEEGVVAHLKTKRGPLQSVAALADGEVGVTDAVVAARQFVF